MEKISLMHCLTIGLRRKELTMLSLGKLQKYIVSAIFVYNTIYACIRGKKALKEEKQICKLTIDTNIWDEDLSQKIMGVLPTSFIILGY